ncbi:ATP-dependent nuclease [Caballeronia novacaledonica]|uniref:ATP-dependent nuclease n=1 Tax=Caballeronia novacaledonica TaxID=1544861 RepID=UPI001C20C69C|nr:ATP-binding protein [Caballeronia novacaledonica]
MIGPGDSGKSTVLDAIEAALSARWLSFNESDFHNCDTTKEIAIEITLGELSKSLLSDERFGMYVRGWSRDGVINDEPEDGDEPLLTVRLTVDATMEPVWQLVCERAEVPRVLSNRDRALFGLVRLAGHDPRHLTWGQGSVLARLTDSNDEAARHLADAYRSARASANLAGIDALKTASGEAERLARSFGAYINGAYGPGLELTRGGFSSGSIALHDNDVPLRLAGLGTRRLATLAIQRASILDGAIVLVDEIEHGLEPHRIIGAIAQLKGAQTEATTSGKPSGQLLMTTHSDVALGEMSPEDIYVVRREPTSKYTTVALPSDPAHLTKIVKKSPRALFARKILVCEGPTEVGLMLGLRELLPRNHHGVPIEQRGAALVDGGGAEAPTVALALAKLGYLVAMYRDSDRKLTAQQARDLATVKVQVFQYPTAIHTETALFESASDSHVQELIDAAREEKGAAAVNASIKQGIPELELDTIKQSFSSWSLLEGVDDKELRVGLAKISSDMSWFKKLHSGREIAPTASKICTNAPASSLAVCLSQVEQWLYE